MCVCVCVGGLKRLVLVKSFFFGLAWGWGDFGQRNMEMDHEFLFHVEII